MSFGRASWAMRSTASMSISDVSCETSYGAMSYSRPDTLIFMPCVRWPPWGSARPMIVSPGRSEEHTSELQSHSDLVCRLLLEKISTTRSTTFLGSHRVTGSAHAPETVARLGCAWSHAAAWVGDISARLLALK